MKKVNAIILAAGKGTRMKSELLKVAHHVAGKPIVSYVLDVVDSVGVDAIYMVIGHQADELKTIIKHPKITYVLQEQQFGTGHAVMQVKDKLNLKTDDTVIVLAGDCPLLQSDTVNQLIHHHERSGSAATILTVKMDDPGMYGRIIRNTEGRVLGIKEAKECTSVEKKINEINTGAYVFNQSLLFESLEHIGTTNKQSEYYLTDIIHILKEAGHGVDAYCMDNPDEAIGVNTREDLASINNALYKHNNQQMMESGVTIIDPNVTFIDSTVRIGKDTIIEPFTIIKGTTTIGKKCMIGAYSYISNGTIHENTQLTPYTIIKDSDKDAEIGSK
jgi:bifunctional UDP-N-acetylglucosamine pyrophosphorylase/glucosamine-1-phosphate N-acetyltransferase